MSEFDARMSAYREAVEAYLNGCFTEDLPQKRLFEAMRYSLLAGGKRIPVSYTHLVRFGEQSRL